MKVAPAFSDVRSSEGHQTETRKEQFQTVEQPWFGFERVSLGGLSDTHVGRADKHLDMAFMEI